MNSETAPATEISEELRFQRRENVQQNLLAACRLIKNRYAADDKELSGLLREIADWLDPAAAPLSFKLHDPEEWMECRTKEVSS